jgi:hypothetical protein
MELTHQIRPCKPSLFAFRLQVISHSKAMNRRYTTANNRSNSAG